MNPPLPPVTHVRDLWEPHESRRALARGAAAGTTTRVARGAYVDPVLHAMLTPREKYLLKVRAVAETRRFSPVLSFWSAAAIHGLPIIGDWPSQVHVTVGHT